MTLANIKEMEQLKNYIKIRRGRNVYSGFPEDPRKNVIVGWLKGNGFREVEFDSSKSNGYNLKYLTKNEKDRVYCLGDYDGGRYHNWIYFGTVGHLFFIRTEEASSDSDAMRYRDYEHHKDTEIYDDINEFANKVNKIFH